MEFLMAENPRKRQRAKKVVHRKRSRKAPRVSTRHRKVGFGRRHHRRAYTATVAHPALHRTRRGTYRRTKVSRSKFPTVRLQNPRRRHYRRHRRNPSFFGGFDLMNTAKTLGGVIVVNAATTELMKVLPVASITTDATITKLLSSGVKIGVAMAARKYGGRFIGQKSADDVVTFITILVAIDLVKTLAGSSVPSLTQYLGAIAPNRPLPMRGTGRAPMGMITPNYGLNGSDGINSLANQGF